MRSKKLGWSDKTDNNFCHLDIEHRGRDTDNMSTTKTQN